jgi:hypothetical protein
MKLPKGAQSNSALNILILNIHVNISKEFNLHLTEKKLCFN